MTRLYVPDRSGQMHMRSRLGQPASCLNTLAWKGATVHRALPFSLQKDLGLLKTESNAEPLKASILLSAIDAYGTGSSF